LTPHEGKKSAGASTARRGVLDPRVVKALGHPVRVQALTILNERVASPNEIAKELDQSVGHVSYHIKVLKECECIELVDTVPRRGAMEHFYSATSRAFFDVSDWATVPQSVRPGLSGSLLRTVVEDASAALTTGVLDKRPDRHLSWTPMILDLEGWQELTKGLAAMLQSAFEIQAASGERLAKTDEPGIPVSVTMLGYETPANKEESGTADRD
jgi:DNA-binding transcriptional ArsR family regulator